MPDVTIDSKELATLRKLAAQAEAYQEQLGTVQSQFDTFRAESSAAIEAARSEERAGFARERAFSDAGIKSERIQRLFSLEFEEQRADGVADFATWMQGIRDAEPEARPEVLAPFLPQAPPASGEVPRHSERGAQYQGGPSRVLNHAPVGPASSPDAGGVFTAESIRGMSAAEFSAAIPTLSKLIPGLDNFHPPGATSENN